MNQTVITKAQYTPGPWVGMAAERMWLVGDLDPGDPVLEAAWPLVAQAATVDQVLTALLAAQMRPPLNLAIARVDETGTEVVVRGDAWAVVAFGPSSGRAPVELRAGQGEFKDMRLDQFEAVSLRLADTGPDEAQPLAAGVVSASHIVIFSNPSTGVEPTDAPPAAPPARPFEAMFGRTIHPTEAGEQAPPVPAEWVAGMRRPDEAPAAAPSHEPEIPLPTPRATTDPHGTEEYRSQFEQPPSVASPPTANSAPAGSARFQDVSWATVSEDPVGGQDAYGNYHAAHPAPTSYQPPAALTPPPSPGYPPYPSAPIQYPATPMPYPSGPPPYPPTPPPYPPTSPPYAGQPAGAPAPYPAQPPLAPAPYAGQPPPAPAPDPGQPAAVQPPHAGGIDPELMATTQRAPSTAVAAGPVVGAVRCATGHLNPPAASQCRVCGGHVPPQTPQPVPRPPLGVLRLSTGEVVSLDRGVILGRAPGVPEGFGRDEPYRIQLASPDGSISRKHAEVVLQGWLVTVADLQSKNGTQLVPPGGVPEQLPPGGRRQIDNGWTVYLDANTWFRFEVTE